MKKGVLVFLLLIISLHLASALEIKEIFTIQKDSVQEDNALTSELGTTSYFYAGSKLIASKNSDNNIEYHHQDRLGSDIESRQLPFGQELVNSGNRFEFTGKELDDKSGLNYFGARYYDSNLGKFTSVDPIKGELAYGYVMNNPMNYVDPIGMATHDPGESQLVVIPSAEGWENVNIFALASYAESKGIAGYNEIYGERTVTNIAQYFMRFNEESGGTPTTDLNSGDLIYLPLTEPINPVDMMNYINSRAESLGIGTYASQSTNQESVTIDKNQLLSDFMEFLNDPRFTLRYQDTAERWLANRGLSQEEIETFLWENSPPPNALVSGDLRSSFSRGIYEGRNVVYDPQNEGLLKVVDTNIRDYRTGPNGRQVSNSWWGRMLYPNSRAASDTTDVRLYKLIQPYYDDIEEY